MLLETLAWSASLWFWISERVHVGNLKVLRGAYPCVAVVTERWMVLGVHGSPERHPHPSICLSAHQWRMASCWADGAAESSSRQLRHQGHRPALSSCTSSPSFNLVVLQDGAQQRNARSVECRFLPVTHQWWAPSLSLKNPSALVTLWNHVAQFPLSNTSPLFWI